MEILILGAGCPKCKATFDVIHSVVIEQKLNAEIKKEEDILEIVKYNIMSLPAIVIDGKVKIKGYVPTREEIINILK